MVLHLSAVGYLFTPARQNSRGRAGIVPHPLRLLLVRLLLVTIIF